MLTCRRLLGLFLGVFLAVSQVPGTARASLIGDVILAQGTGLTPTFASIGAGPEFVGYTGLINFDFDATSLTLTPSSIGIGCPPGGCVNPGSQGLYLFTSLDWVGDPSGFITGVTPVIIQGIIPAIAFPVTFTAHSLTLDMFGTTIFASLNITYEITTQHAVPEPSTLAILAVGLAGLGFVTRRRRIGIGKTRHAS